MPKHEFQAQGENERQGDRMRRERKQRVLTQGMPSITESAADAVVAKNWNIIEAATHFERHRLPEVFSGFVRDEYEVPVRYPVANRPLAMASGADLRFERTAKGGVAVEVLRVDGRLDVEEEEEEAS